MINSDQIKDMLLHTGYAQVYYPAGLQQAVDNFVNAWIGFLKQSVEHKSLIPFGKNGGYENKDQALNPNLLDHKEDFHITKLYDFPEGLNQTAEDITFLATGQALFKEIAPTLRLVAEVWSEITGVDFVKLAVEREDGWTIRSLYYPPQENEILAHYHPDKGGYTFHLYDSVPGFECFWEGRWQSMSFPKNKMIFFPGMLGQFYNKCKFPALTHRVISSLQSRIVGRISIVLFNDYANADMKYDKDTFGPTQKLFVPGGNYSILFDKFKKYFINRGFATDSK